MDKWDFTTIFLCRTWILIARFYGVEALYSSEVFELIAIPVEGQSLRQRDKERRKSKDQKKLKKYKKPEDLKTENPKCLFVHMPKQKCGKTQR